MNDLDLLRDLGARLDPDDLEATQRIRARVLTDLATGHRPRRPFAGRMLPGRQGMRRPLLWLVPAGAAAAAVGLVASGALPLGGSAVPTPSTSVAQNGSGVVNLDARGILLAAAAHARSRPNDVPASNAFIYIRQTGMGLNGEPAQETKWVNEAWLSVDGRQVGLRSNDQTGAVPVDGALEPTGRCLGEPIPDVEKTGFPIPYCDGPGYVSDIPGDAAGALEYLRRPKSWLNWVPFLDGKPGSDAQRGSDDDVVFNVHQLMFRHVLSPASRAGVFEALSQLKGITVVPNVANDLGRSAVAVTVPDSIGGRTDVVFDAATHELIGSRSIDRGRIVSTFWIAETAVVTTPGVRPDGSIVRKGKDTFGDARDLPGKWVS